VKFHMKISSCYLENGNNIISYFSVAEPAGTRGSPGLTGVTEAPLETPKEGIKKNGNGEGPRRQPIRRFRKSHKLLLDLRAVVREQLFAGCLFADNYSQDLFSQAMLSAASVVRRTVMRTGSYLSSRK